MAQKEKPSPFTHEADVADFIGLLSSQALEQYAQTEDQKAYWVHLCAFYFFVSRCWQAKLQGNDPFDERGSEPNPNQWYYGIRVRSHSEINSPELAAHSEINSPELAAHSEINSPELAAHSEINSPELAGESEINSPELTAQPKINSPELKRKRRPKGTR